VNREFSSSTVSRQPLVPFATHDVPDRLRGGVVAIGNFDGVHTGHASLLRAAVEQAARNAAPAIVLTFEPHPRTFFKPDQPVFRLTPVSARARLFAALDVDGLVVATFDEALSSLPAETFVERILLEQLAIRGAVVGYDFHYGRGRGGNAESLRRAGEQHGFTLSVIDPVAIGETVIASRAVRAALRAGDVITANGLLGYRWFVTGEVIAGAMRGRDLGYPTANMALRPDCDLRHGVYAVSVRLADGRDLGGVASFGRRPTFDDGPPLLETHIFDLAEDLYGQQVVVSFVGWIRAEARFASIDELITAMDADATEARRQLAGSPPPSALDHALGKVG